MNKNLKTGYDLKEQGMQLALFNADNASLNWSERAFNFLMDYARKNKEFMVEEVREASLATIPEPPNLRAWGAVVCRASREKLIFRIGYRNVTNKKAHSTPAAVWSIIKPTVT